jgi:sarcosine oxidase, subunit gamma
MFDLAALTITNVSYLARFGVKGAQAAAWLAMHGVKIPEAANTWVIHEQTLVMRLGLTEFLIEDQTGGESCKKLLADTERVPNVYKVPRADAAYLLAGSDVLNLLSELCALDLRENSLLEHDVVMTQVAGISATILRQTLNNEPVYRLWCDGTYNSFMQHVLDEIAVELGNISGETF